MVSIDQCISTAPVVALPLQGHLERWTAEWWADNAATPAWGPAYTPAAQRACEAEVERFLKAVAAELRRRPAGEAGRAAAQARLLQAAERLAGPLLGIDGDMLRALAQSGLTDAAAEFVRQARRFDPALRPEDIYQASRNVWTMNAVQLILGQPVCMTPAIFAYSMLYPYTDNFLDDPGIAAGAKRAFAERFGRRLAGEDVAPADAGEARIHSLVGMVEGQFPRPEHPQVYASLLAIHEAQTRSVALLGQGAAPGAADVLAITFEKGGASVVADGYLVAGAVTDAQADFLFGYGALTQLLDDLEDVTQDRRAGLATVFSQRAGHVPLDEATARMLHLGARLLGRLEALRAPQAEPLCRVMARGLQPALIATAGRAARLHSPDYRRALEAHAPCRFAFVDRVSKRLAQRGWLEALLQMAS